MKYAIRIASFGFFAINKRINYTYQEENKMKSWRMKIARLAMVTISMAVLCIPAGVFAASGWDFIDTQAIIINATNITIKVGDTQDLTVEVYPDIDENKEVTWSSDNNLVATVGQDGMVTGVKGGVAKIIATANSGRTASCTVVVLGLPEKLSLEKTNVSLEIDESIKLKTKMEPLAVSDESLSWTSSNTNVATVGPNGTVTGISPGIVTIRAMTSNGKSASCRVTVFAPIGWIKLAPTEVNISVGKSTQLNATADANLSGRTSLTWSTSDTTIATVDENGKVTGKKPGKAFVTVTTSDGKTAQVKVQVSVSMTSVALSPSTMVVSEGSSTTITAILSPSYATLDGVSWSSNNEDIATVDDFGILTAHKAGQVTITARAGGKSGICQVTVVCDADGIELNHDALKMYALSTGELIAKIISDGPTDGKLTWSSSDKSIVNVTNGKLLAGKNQGTATITVTTSKGRTDTCHITVVVPVTSIKINHGEVLIMNPSDEKTLEVDVFPSDATDPTLTWTSDSNIISIGADGTIKALAVGKATIYATPVEGTARGICSVVVVDPMAALEIVANAPVVGNTVDVSMTNNIKLTALINGKSSDIRSASWKSADHSIASTDNTGKVIGIKPGITTITATVGDKEATIDVHVITEITSVLLNTTSKAMNVNEDFQFTTTIVPNSATYHNVTWRSSNKNAATIDSNGIVTALAKGVTNITATTVNGKQATALVTVYSDTKKLSLSSTQLTVVIGEKYKKIKIIGEPDNEGVILSSKDPSIARVDEYGNITAVGKGTTLVVATAPNGLTAECQVTSVSLVNGISLNTTALTLHQGDTSELVATLTPLDADNGDFQWTSDNPNIALVDQYGRVTANQIGKATIYATTTDNSKTVACVVTVLKPLIKTTDILMDGTLSLKAGDTHSFNLTVLPNDADNKQVIFSSSNPNVLKINESGVITALAAGSATITVTTADGQVTKTCQGTVDYGVTAVKINVSMLTLTEGQIAQLLAEVFSKEANQEVVWASNRPNIVAVDEKTGELTAIAEGKANITATSVDNGKAAACAVTVEKGPTKLTLRATLALEMGKTYKFAPEISPSTVKNKSLTWESSDPSIAMVESDGTIVGINLGSTIITATTVNGKTAACDVTVTTQSPGPGPVITDPAITGKFVFKDSKGTAYSLKVTGDWVDLYDNVVHGTGTNLETGYVYFDGKENCVYVAIKSEFMQPQANSNLSLRALYDKYPTAFLKVQDGSVVKTIAGAPHGRWIDGKPKKGTLYIKPDNTVYIAPIDVNESTMPPAVWIELKNQI